jgi:hypothetical protein
MVAVLAACAAPAEAPPQPQAAASSGAVPAPLEWSADLVEGGQLQGGDLAGGDVALWFWAPW